MTNNNMNYLTRPSYPYRIANNAVRWIKHGLQFTPEETGLREANSINVRQAENDIFVS